MRRLSILTIMAAIELLAIPIRASQAQTALNEVTCIQGNPLACLDGSSSLRKSTAGDTYVTAAGFYKAADGGGGEFYRIGAQPAFCNSVSAAGTISPNSTTIGFSPSPPTGLTVGEGVSGSGIQPGSEIASIGASSITITLAATGSGLQTISFLGDNGGTLILDSESPNKGCYQKTNYRGEPHEWGAYGDGLSTHDDTVAIQNWLGAYGSVSNLAPGTAPANFGPWIATIPATYLVSSPLFCPPNATIQGDENDANIGTGSNPNPRINFKASSTFSGFTYPASPPATYFGLQGVFGAYDYCRLFGIAVTGNKFDLTTSGNTHGTTTIDGLGSTSGVQIGNTVAGGDIGAGTVVTVVNSTCSSSCSVTVSQATTGSGTTGETIDFYGPDAVDVLGNKVTIDGFSFLADGRDDLFCGILSLGNLGLQVKDTHLKSAMLDGIDIPGPCSNVRLIGDNVSEAGGDGILFGATEGSIEGGVIQDSGGAGLRLAGASLLSVTGMHIQGNGTQGSGSTVEGDATAGIAIDWGHTITICNNHMEGNGGDDDDSAQIFFKHKSQHVIDNVNLCGNVYDVQIAGKKSPTVDVSPSYVYDADSDAVITNTHIYETAAQPAVSVFSPTALPLLQSSVVPQIMQNQISGLTLSNDPMLSQAIDISAGSTSDSTNSSLIALPSTGGTYACRVNLAASGPGGLDTGSVAASTTYFIFAIAPASGNGTPSCMASKSLTPTFQGSGTPFNGTGYVTGGISGGAQNGVTTLYNVTPLNGVSVGNEITASDSSIPTSPKTTIASFSANAPSSATASWSTGATVLTSVSPIANVYYGMGVADLSNNCIPSGDYVSAIDVVLDKITLATYGGGSAATTCGMGGTYNLTLSGARQLVLSAAPTASELETLKISTAYYRLIGAIYTDSASNVVKFTQDGDTVYLSAPQRDVNTTTVATSGTSIPLPSIPNGVSVEALGRCVAGATNVLLYAPGLTPGTPTDFSTKPGYSVKSATSATAFPFRLYTDTSQHIKAAASTGSTTLQCETDGWVFHR